MTDPRQQPLLIIVRRIVKDIFKHQIQYPSKARTGIDPHVHQIFSRQGKLPYRQTVTSFYDPLEHGFKIIYNAVCIFKPEVAVIFFVRVTIIKADKGGNRKFSAYMGYIKAFYAYRQACRTLL